MQLSSQSVWLSICLLGGTCITVAVVVVISLIPTYVPERNPFEAEDGVAVPSENMVLSFASDLSGTDATAFNRSTVANTDAIARQLESMYALSRRSLSVSSVEPEDFSTDDSSTSARALNRVDRAASAGTIDLLIRVTIDYVWLCGRLNRCKRKMHERIIRSVKQHRGRSAVFVLQFKDGFQLTTSIFTCVAQAMTRTGSAPFTRIRGKSCLDSNVEMCSDGSLPDLYDATISELQAGLQAGHFTSVDLVHAYLARIDEVNLKGPALRAILETSPVALDAAREADELRANGSARSPLHGIPILLKDNIATRPEDGMGTTAGSFALLNCTTPGDATVAEKLREAGAIILGKTSLSEWANFRGLDIPNGWSAIGGQASSAFYPQGDACGSSTGSGIAASIGLAAGTLGTETDGSIVCPGNRNNLVGLKPTVGLTSRHLVIPISQTQDSVGPMCRTVADVAAMLSVVAGQDPEDNHTLLQPESVPDYTEHLNKDGLRGARIGVLRKVFANATMGGYPEYIVKEFNRTIEDTLKKLGAEIIDPADLPNVYDIADGDDELLVLTFELKDGINHYLSLMENIPEGTRTLTDLINYNIDDRERELPPGRDNQHWFTESDDTTDLHDERYLDAMDKNADLVKTRGLDALFNEYNLDALIAPTEGYTSRPPAIAGYPIITVPLGFLPSETPPAINSNTTKYTLPIYPAPNFPFGLSFIGRPYSEARLIELAYSYEQATHNRRKSMPFASALPKTQLADIICRR